MSLYGSLMGDIEDDPFFGSHMRTMRHMNSMMNSLFADPFGMMGAVPPPDFGSRAIAQHHHQQQQQQLQHRNSIGNIHNSLMNFGGFPMPGFNRLMSGSLDSLGNAHCYSSSTVVSMTSGPDGRPEVYKATSSTRTAPGGIKETQRTVCDSRTGTKKMAIGHHIGERAHIIEREQNVHSGDQEERQDFINIEEEEAEDFNKEWETKSRSERRADLARLQGARYAVPAITAGPSRRHRDRLSMVAPRRAIRSPLLALPSSSSASSALASNRSPYHAPGHHQHGRRHKSMKSVSGGPPSPQEELKITELVD